MQEAQFHTHKLFLTLTYSDEQLPPGHSLRKRDFQLFMKKLRKANPGTRIRYFMCGEYGDQSNRPHYHAMLFGYECKDKRKHSGKEDSTLYTSETLEKTWGFGHVLFGSVTWASAAYVARYVIKKRNGEHAAEWYRTVDKDTGETFERLPEYINMSTQPGIGRQFYENFKTDIYPSDFTVTAGKRKKVPAYYDRLLEKDSPDDHSAIKSGRKQRAREPARKENSTPDRLVVREAVQKARLNQLKRKL